MLTISGYRHGPAATAVRVIGVPLAALLLMLAGRSLALMAEQPASFAGPTVIVADTPHA